MVAEDKAAYVIVEIEGPFGPINQVSDRMRLSEAAATAADIMPHIPLPSPSKKVARVWISAVRVVRLTSDA
jgi:hypothetical protein